ncbi:hypothetical protein DFH07DRAFT_954402 [Mycena maculata]|uniref:Uncharacterized protein n=1 Tax=Mycena maculata TaxID=230809 RepID=A0AAD7NP66_9AGAR|nr:hypothetical protein DFH07DRAFT_954402 [Mycena maculata]
MASDWSYVDNVKAAVKEPRMPVFLWSQPSQLRTSLAMRPSTSLVALLSLASVVVSSTIPGKGISSCKANDRVLVDTRTVTAGGYKFQVSTKACSTDALASRAFTKRQTFNSCAAGETTTYTCVTNEGTGPLESDCTALLTAVKAADEGSGDPTLFTVPPQFVEEFSLGTCLFAWFNDNPVGGATLEYFGTNMGGILDEDCIVNGDTGGYVIPSNPNLVPASLDWVFEVLRS